MAWDNIISRGIWVLIQLSNFIIFILIISMIIYKFNTKNTILKILARKTIPISLLFLFITGFTNISYWLTFPIEGRFDSYRNIIDDGPYSGIIVLAGAERTSISTTSEQATVNIGTDIKRIRFDRKSYNTHSNALETLELITPGENNKWFLVTSAYHMPRSVAAYRKAGVSIQPYPVDYRTTLKYDGIFNFDFSKNLFHFDLIIHEYIGLLAYYITGRSSSLFPE